MLYFSGLQRENKWKEILAGIWFARRLVVLGLRFATVFHFSPLPLVRYPHPREPAPQTRKRYPLAMPCHPPPAIMAIVAGLRGEKLTDCIESAGIAKQTRMNSTIGHNHYCANRVHTRVSRLKRRTPHASRHASRQAGGRGCA